MTGGIGSVVHRLTIDHGSYRDVLVLRQYGPGVLALVGSDTAALVRDESAKVGGRAPVDTAGMTSRVEDLLEATLGRIC
jgi:hypothetical protein